MPANPCAGLSWDPTRGQPAVGAKLPLLGTQPGGLLALPAAAGQPRGAPTLQTHAATAPEPGSFGEDAVVGTVVATHALRGVAGLAAVPTGAAQLLAWPALVQDLIRWAQDLAGGAGPHQLGTGPGRWCRASSGGHRAFHMVQGLVMGAVLPSIASGHHQENE